MAFPGTGEAPLVAHVIHALRMGGLENGLVNLINHMDPGRFRHAIVCMRDYDEFRQRIARADVPVIAVHQERLGRFGRYAALYRIFRRLRPSIVHGRNWDGLDAVLPAALAGVAARVQGEHGRDMHDLDGSNRRLQRLRRLCRPLTTHYTTVSRDLADYLHRQVGVDRERITQIYNGVDTARFHPAPGGRAPLPESGAFEPDAFVVGTVARLQPVKDHLTLLRAAADLIRSDRAAARRLRVVIVGEGPARVALEREIAASGLGHHVLLPGARGDVPAWLRGFDLFVLPSLAEGISNTLLEAMATGLPAVATDVGGNADLVADGETGRIIPSGSPQALAAAIGGYLGDAAALRAHGAAARTRAELRFSIPAMVAGYAGVYDRVLGRRPAVLDRGAVSGNA